MSKKDVSPEQPKILFCHWDLLRFLEEKHLQNDDGSYRTLSVTGSGEEEFQLFLDKTDTGYDVTVIKCPENGTYSPKEDDNVVSFKETNEKAVFHFNDFNTAHKFLDLLGYRHQEYEVRPVRPINYVQEETKQEDKER